MPLLRLLLIVLVLFNLLALAAGQGWLGTSVPRGEPERLTNQIKPEAIVLTPALSSAPANGDPAVAPPAVAPPTVAPPTVAPPTVAQPAPATFREDAAVVATADRDRTEVPPTPAPQDESPACVAYVLAQPQAEELERIARAAHPSIVMRRTLIDPASTWWVRIPPFSSRAAAEKRMNEVRELGVTDLFVVREPGPHQNAISLGLFRTEASARQHLADLADKRISDAQVIVRNPATLRIEMAATSTVIESLATRLAATMPQAGRRACVPG